MEHMTAGYDSGEKTALQAVAYVSFQELATRVSHRNTGAATGCPMAEQLLARIAQDENLHMIFYRNLVQAALDRAPDETMSAIRDEVVGFTMPGAGMTDFQRNSVTSPRPASTTCGCTTTRSSCRCCKFWKVFDRTDFGPRRRAGPGGAGRRSWPGSTRRPPGSSSSGRSCVTGRRPGRRDSRRDCPGRRHRSWTGLVGSGRRLVGRPPARLREGHQRHIPARFASPPRDGPGGLRRGNSRRGARGEPVELWQRGGMNVSRVTAAGSARR